MIARPGLVYLVDDEAGMIKALERLLRAEGFEVRGFTSPVDFLKSYRPVPNSCLVLDVAMPGLDGLNLQKQLTHQGSMLPIVFLSGKADIPISVQAMKAGAVDFLTKPVESDRLVKAVTAALARAFEQRAISEVAQRLTLLTDRQREVMQHVVSGKLNKQIAADLGTSEQNIKIHRARVMRKMGVESLAELVRVSDRLGLGGTARSGHGALSVS